MGDACPKCGTEMTLEADEYDLVPRRPGGQPAGLPAPEMSEPGQVIPLAVHICWACGYIELRHAEIMRRGLPRITP